jgi:hypothetical protein
MSRRPSLREPILVTGAITASRLEASTLLTTTANVIRVRDVIAVTPFSTQDPGKLAY